MQIVIEIPEDKIPSKQCYKDVLIKFVDRQVCEVTLIGQIPREDETGLWFDVLPEGHGDLIDADETIANLQKQCDEVFKLGKVKPEDYYIAKDAKFMQDTWRTWCVDFNKWLTNRPVVIPAEKDGD